MLDSPQVCVKPEGRCADESYRLAVYQAGHALVARALGHRIIQVRMLPRPPITITDKAFVGNNWDSFLEMLENRVIELFGGQIAEEILCDSTHCCVGDIHRIDELTRLIAGMNGLEDHEDVFFGFETISQEIFEKPQYREAIKPLAEFLFAREEEGEFEIDGAEVDAVINELIPPEETKRGLVFGNLRKLFGA